MTIECKVLNQGIVWILANQENFSLAHADSSQDRLMLLKPLGELVLTLSILKRQNICHDLVAELSQWAWSQLREGEELIELLLVRPDLMVLSSLYANFCELGIQKERVLDVVKNYSESAGSMSVELPKWRKLDICHSLENLGISDFPDSPELGTWMEKCPEPWKISDDIAYAVTHDIFYITDFGRKPGRLKEELVEYLELWVPAWIDIYLTQRNLDLAAEFIMVMSCIGRAEIDEKIIDHIYKHQESDGMIPSPKHAGSKFLKGGESLERKRFLSNYHTTLVSVMAMSMRLGNANKLLHAENYSASLLNFR